MDKGIKDFCLSGTCEKVEQLQAENKKLEDKYKDVCEENQKARGPCECGEPINHDYCPKCIKDWAS